MTLEPHIPAWKRLGLKLKFAKDEPPLQPSIVDTKKRKAEDALLVQQDDKLDRTSRVAKKAKASPASAANGHRAVDREDEHDDHNNAQTTAQPHARREEEPVKVSTATKSKPREKKSVTFTPETKEANGQSMKDLYQTWVKTQQNGIDSENGRAQNNLNGSTETNTEAAGEGEDGQPLGEATVSPEEIVAASNTDGDVSTDNDSNTDAAPPTPKKSKKKKKKGTKKSKTTRLTSPPTSHPPPASSSPESDPPPSTSNPSHSPSHPTSQLPSPTAALSYLSTFHTSPSTWKFSKNHQTYLLKHILSLAKVPSQYNPALLAYLKGLKGRAAKADLRKRAREAREADEAWLAGKGDGDAEGEDPVAGIAGSSPERYESRWRERLRGVLRDNEQTGLHSNETSDTDDNDNKDKDLEWRTDRRVRAEIIFVAVGAEASPSPSSSPPPESEPSIPANLPVRPVAASNSVVKQHIKFDDTVIAVDRTPATKDDRDQLSTHRDHNASHHHWKPSGVKIAGNGIDGKPGRGTAAAADNEVGKQPKKRKRKRKSRVRTAVSDNSSSESSSSSSSSSDSSSDEDS